MYIQRDSSGNWKAEDIIKLENNRELSITTRRNSNKALVTSASVSTRDGMFVRHMVYEDYYRVIGISTPKRITQKTVETQHLACMTDCMEAVMDEIKVKYQAKGEENTCTE